jgi:hypothetical protein
MLQLRFYILYLAFFFIDCEKGVAFVEEYNKRFISYVFKMSLLFTPLGRI